MTDKKPSSVTVTDEFDVSAHFPVGMRWYPAPSHVSNCSIASEQKYSQPKQPQAQAQAQPQPRSCVTGEEEKEDDEDDTKDEEEEEKKAPDNNIIAILSQSVDLDALSKQSLSMLQSLGLSSSPSNSSNQISPSSLAMDVLTTVANSVLNSLQSQQQQQKQQQNVKPEPLVRKPRMVASMTTQPQTQRNMNTTTTPAPVPAPTRTSTKRGKWYTKQRGSEGKMTYTIPVPAAVQASHVSPCFNHINNTVVVTFPKELYPNLKKYQYTIPLIAKVKPHQVNVQFDQVRRELHVTVVFPKSSYMSRLPMSVV